MGGRCLGVERCRGDKPYPRGLATIPLNAPGSGIRENSEPKPQLPAGLSRSRLWAAAAISRTRAAYRWRMPSASMRRLLLWPLARQRRSA